MRAIKFLIRMVLGIVLLTAFYFTVGLILSVISTNPPETICAEQREIFISSNGIHLDFVIPTSMLKEEVLRELKIPDQAEFASFGWGDRGFYLQTPTWNDLTFTVAFNALFLPSETAMHVDYFYRRSDSWTALHLCDSQYAVLSKFIFDSFHNNNDGEPISIEFSGYNDTDRFYEAIGSYNLIKTCNEWVNIGLKQAHVETSVWSPFEFGVIHQLEDHQDSQ